MVNRLRVDWMFFAFLYIVILTTLTQATANATKHPTCQETAQRVLKPYIERLKTAESAEKEYDLKLSQRKQEIEEFMIKLNQTRQDFDLAEKKDLNSRDQKIAYMLEAIKEIRQKVTDDIARLKQKSREALAEGRESTSKSYSQNAQKLSEKLAIGEANGHKQELGWSSSINGWKEQIRKTRDDRNKRAASWSAGSIHIHITFLGYSLSWSGVQQRLIKEREKLAVASRRELGFHLTPLGYTLNGQGIKDLVTKRKKELNDARSQIAAGTFKLHIPTFGFTADRNYAKKRMSDAKAKLQKDTAAWAKGTYKTHSKALGYTTSNGDIQKTIEKKQAALARFIADGDKTKVHVPEIGYTTSGEAIKEAIQKAQTAKIRSLWERNYTYWRKAIAKEIQKRRADIRRWKDILSEFKRQWQEDLKKQKKYIDTILTWALGETPCGGSGIGANTTIVSPTLPSNPPPKLEDIPEFRDFRGLDDKRLSRENWKKWVQLHCKKLVESVNSYPGIHNNILIPGETQDDIDKGLIKGYFGEGALAKLLSMDDLPAEHRSDNIYAAVTEKAEQKLRIAILNAKPDSLLPWNIMQMALDASGGSYPLAVLTVHAVLKTATKLGRNETQGMFRRAGQNRWNEVDKLRNNLHPHSEIAKRLRNLRPKGDTSHDKLGPWYHAFGLLSAGALVSPLQAKIGAQGEHWLKWFKAYGNAEGAYNRVKNTTDVIFANCSSHLYIYNRFYTPVTREQIDSLMQRSRR